MDKKLEAAARDYHALPRPGKIEVRPTKPHNTQHDLTLAYSPGVAVPCKDIQADPEKAYDYTAKVNLVAVISNGTAVLGLGDIGAMAGKPVIALVSFSDFGSIDAPSTIGARRAIEILHRDHPEIEVEGDMQLMNALAFWVPLGHA